MIPAEGNLETAKLIFVGAYPNNFELREGRPFVGPAGRVLTDILHALNVPRHDCYFTFVIKKTNLPSTHFYNLKTGFTEFGTSQVELLMEELTTSTQPIILLGNIPLNAFFSFVGVNKWRGSILRNPTKTDQFIIPTLHPETVIPPQKVFTNKLLIQHDINKAIKIITGEYKPTERKIEILQEHGKAMSLLDKLYWSGINGKIIYYDIEIYNNEVSCISFTDSAEVSYCIPFVQSTMDIFSTSAEAQIWRAIARILEQPEITKAGQNITFDSHFLLRKYGIKGTNFHDTMIAQRTLMPDYPMGLDFITSIWTDHKYYKDEGKAFFKGGGSWERLWHYNATDSIICAEALPKQLEAITKQDNMAAYDRQRKLIEPLTFMMEHGIRVDLEGIRKQGEEIDTKLIELQEELNTVAGKELNPNSPKQLKEHFYGTLGHAPYRKRGGGITTDALALKRLSRKGVVEAQLVQQMRQLKKVRSTYLNLDKFDSDSRLRCSYNPVGTKFSRLSSSESIFGTGMNNQNLNEEILQYMMADKNHVLYRFDLAQAENRIVAYAGNVTAMITAFEEGVDLHSMTASLIFQKPIDQISKEKGSSSLGDGKHSERDWGKRSNHGLNYDLSYRSFALLYEMPENQAKFIVESYHKAYPGVRGTYHQMIKRMLSSNRTITNLMGRKTMLLGEWGDSLFKEGYSCIPQGTVGDIINERGVLYIYFTLGPHYPIRLLTQVHDEVGFELPLTMSWKEHAEVLNKIKTSLEIPLTAQGRTFTIPADLTMSLTFSKLHNKDLSASDWFKNKNDLAKWLEQSHNELAADPANSRYFTC